MKKRYAGYIAPEKPAYDVLMDDYERGMNQEDMDAFFGELKAALAPLIGKLKDAEQPDVSFMEGTFDVQRQKALSQAVMDIMGLDRSRCVLGESAHPFTTEFSKFDVRITTRYAEDDMASNLYSVIHEGGHAMYELSISDGLAHSVLGEGASTAIHESQSRLWENYIGRSPGFLRTSAAAAEGTVSRPVCRGYGGRALPRRQHGPAVPDPDRGRRADLSDAHFDPL